MTAPVKTEETRLIRELAEKTIQFPEGLPGFSNQKRFVLTREQAQEAPFFTLNSLDDPKLNLIVLEPAALVSDYKATIDEKDLISISSPQEKERAVLVVVQLTKTSAGKIEIQANLRSPIVINTALKTAKQVILKNPPSQYIETAKFEF
jgi:flagellar assembly factor FliW